MIKDHLSSGLEFGFPTEWFDRKVLLKTTTVESVTPKTTGPESTSYSVSSYMTELFIQPG